ncbi:hypothetical protein [Rhizomicrobium electricum]|uniref:Uncharacterized protein n=1 Tax=Rhizomicrobium electricum TaxID=480070 RepID=A0ABN1ECX3_9PROT|nr:hypothetical protein [Rhizomicrobium electricum]NIJ48257.1 hypothetical protein [Rhizomicrobium electricum]
MSAAGPFTFDAYGNAQITIRFALVNVGTSPAFGVHPWPEIHAPIVGITTEFSYSDLQRKLINKIIKEKNLNSVGYTIFPGEPPRTVEMTVPWMANDLKRVTQKTKMVFPCIVGAVLYRASVDEEIHKTGFLFDVRRLTKGNPSPLGFRAEGEIPADELVFENSPAPGNIVD